ncbi:MAG: hypothetical protein ABSD59_23025 [Terracidiphilus sp.]|jgi:hypothetical protein
MTINSLTLTNKSGKTVTVFSTPQSAEFIHLNGSVEPLTTVTIPGDVYTAATASVGGIFAACVAMDPATGGLFINEALTEDTVPASAVTVKMSAPVTITGTSMALSLDLQVSPSLDLPNCYETSTNPITFTPTINLTALTIAAHQPTTTTNGRAMGLRGVITTVDTNGTGFTVTGADGPTWQVGSNNDTVFQGVTDASKLVAGMPVDMDVAIQPDSSLLATRVGIFDANPSTLTMASGTMIEVAATQSTLFALVDEYEGPIQYGLGGAPPFSFGNAVFQISGELTNVQSLPFTASFNATNMVTGQKVFITTHATSESGYPVYVPVSTMTLLPQTIYGTVSAVSTSGSFTTYTVTLAAYDLFPTLAVQSGQTTQVSNPGSVVVYVDSNTQLLNTDFIAVGSVLRFNGLVFNDNGTLRMDCAQINDGVAE